MRLTVKGDVKKIQKDLGKLRRKDQPKAASAALNRTRTRVRTQAVRRTASATGAIQKFIRARVAFGRTSDGCSRRSGCA